MPDGIAMVLYDLPTWLIVAALLALTLAANEVGYRMGLRRQRTESELSRTVSNALKGSTFALVALLLAFSFSATSSRYELRQRLVLDQANAVGTCYLRAGLLAEPGRTQIRSVLVEYLDVRLEHYQAGYHTEAGKQLRTRIDGLMARLWEQIETANRADPQGVRTSLIVPAANEVIDLSSTRAWANQNHLPDPVLAMLLGSLVISSLLLGHSSGQAATRHVGLWLASNLVLGLVLYVVLDFDRPRRGLIVVDQTPLVELRATLEPRG